MAYDKKLANKIREALGHISHLSENEKMGGLSFMVDGKMCVRVEKDELMLRCEPGRTDELLGRKGAKRYEMQGKPEMQGWLIISSEGFASKADFDYWMDIALNANKIAKPSRKIAK